MEVRWWQGGLHIHPETDAERTALTTLAVGLDLVRINHQVETGPVLGAVDAINEHPIVGIDVLAHPITDSRGVDVIPADDPLRQQDPPSADAR